MSFNTLLTHTVTTYRNLPTGVGIQKSYRQNLLNQPVMIQPLSAEYAQSVNETFGRSYNMFVPYGIDIQIADKIIDQDGKEYRVKGSSKRNYGSVEHNTFIISEQVTSTPDQ